MRPLIPAFLLLMAAASCLGSGCDDPLARRFVPPELFEDGGVLDCAIARVSFAGVSHAAIAYTNGSEGKFVLVKGSGDDATVAFSLQQAGMAGTSPKVALEDLDADVTPEVVVSYTSDHGYPSTWLFRYSDGHLVSITPPHARDAEWSALADVEFIDYDADGRKDAVNREVVAVTRESPDEGPVATVAQSVYTWSGSSYAAEPHPLVFFSSYERRTAKSVAPSDTFTFSGEDPARTLRIVNAAATGVPASSATVILNGAAVATPDAFKRQQHAIDIPVRLLAGENTISVEIAGEPRASLAVFVY